MSISKNYLRLFDSSVSSGARSSNSKKIHWVCAAVFAGLILFGGSAKAAFTPYNALVNPGAEVGNVTGWNTSLTGYIWVVSTNEWMAGVTNGTISTNQILAHSGAYAFQTFDITADSAYMYQDYAAAAGSQWSASCWAICYASNYFDSAFAYMSVAFYDTNNNVLGLYSDPGFGTYGYGVYAGVVLDPVNFDGTYIIAPPQAHDPNGWLYLPATNFWYSYTPANTNNAPGTNIETVANLPLAVSSTLVAPPGTAFVRYQLEYDNMSTDGGAVYWDDCVLQKLNQTDPDITNPQPASVIVWGIGQPASFTVHAIKALKSEVLTYQWQKNGTNLPVFPGGDIAGSSTNATLQFTNCQYSDAGSYACWVSDAAGSIRSVPATLTAYIPPPCPHPNRLGNPGFESAPVWTPWEPFDGCYFVNGGYFYDPGQTTPVNILDGYWCAMVGANGDRDNGFHQAIAGVTPGTYWKAGGWAYISSANPFTDANTCRLQIWFRDANGNSVPGTPTYEAFKIYGLAYTNADMQYTNIDVSSPFYGQKMYHTFLPNDTWCYLPVTNIVNNGGTGLQDDLPINTFPDGVFMVPTNANVAQINYQVYEYCPLSTDTGRAGEYNGNGTDAVYWDDMQLIQVFPPPYFTASVDGANINLSLCAAAGLGYTLVYKTNITDTHWLLLTNVMAPMSWQTNRFRCSDDCYPITVSDPITSQSRFYRVQVQ